MNDHGLTTGNLLASFPEALRHDASLAALASAVADILSKRPKEIGRIAVYPSIDDLDESLLDILARDFKVDWYDYNYDADIKRALFKSSFAVHRFLGTRGAVTRALTGIYSAASVKEWFEYGGNPYCFKILLYDQDMPVSIPAKEIRKAVEFYKSLRSHLEKITMIIEAAARLKLGFSWRLAMRTRLSIWGMQEVRLNGSRNLKGEWILSSVWERGAHLKKFALHHQKQMPLRMAAYMAITQRTGFEYRKIPKLPRFAVRTRNNVYSPQTMMLDGSHRLDGGGQLGTVFIRGGALRMCAFRASVSASPCIKAGLSRNNMWRLDGSRSLDGEQLLNADVITSDL